MNNFNLTNEEIVYLFKHLENYRNIIRDDVTRNQSWVKGQMKLYKEVYGDTEEFDEELYNLYDQLINHELPKSTTTKMTMIESLLEKLSPVFQMIEESDADLVTNVVETYLTESKESQNLVTEIQNKSHGHPDQL